jgi:hypothetical protein
MCYALPLQFSYLMSTGVARHPSARYLRLKTLTSCSRRPSSGSFSTSTLYALPRIAEVLAELFNTLVWSLILHCCSFGKVLDTSGDRCYNRLA